MGPPQAQSWINLCHTFGRVGWGEAFLETQTLHLGKAVGGATPIALLEDSGRWLYHCLLALCPCCFSTWLPCSHTQYLKRSQDCIVALGYIVTLLPQEVGRNRELRPCHSCAGLKLGERSWRKWRRD